MTVVVNVIRILKMLLTFAFIVVAHGDLHDSMFRHLTFNRQIIQFNFHPLKVVSR